MSTINYQQELKEAKNRLDSFLTSLPVAIEDLPDIGSKVKFFIYFLTIKEGEGIALKSELLELFDLADINRPAYIERDIKKLLKEKIIIPLDEGYRLHRKTHQHIESQLQVRQNAVVLKQNLNDLSKKLKDPVEKEFIDEAIRCFGCRPPAKRATIILSWVVCIDHLQNYVWNNKKTLKIFNQYLPLQKKKLLNIKQRNDFTEIDESLFILLLRQGKIVDGNIYKLLDKNLKLRDSCAHPNKLIVSDPTVEAFVEDIIQNILLHFK